MIKYIYLQVIKDNLHYSKNVVVRVQCDAQKTPLNRKWREVLKTLELDKIFKVTIRPKSKPVING